MKFINSITIENFRGIKEKQNFLLANPGDITFFIGQNNSGKSLISKCLAIINRIDGSPHLLDLKDLDFHNCETDDPIKIHLHLNKTALPAENPNTMRLTGFKEVVLSYIIVKENSQYRGYVFVNHSEDDCYETVANGEANVLQYSQRFIDGVAPLNNELLKRTLQFLLTQVKECFLIFAPIRSFYGDTDRAFKSGVELVRWLDANKNSGVVKGAKARVGIYLERLNLEVPVDITPEENRLVFTFDGYLRLSSDDVGTGYTMIYIILMEIIRESKKIIVVDEIESHLQPGLIRELIGIVREIGKEQYLISTHSPTVIECARETDYLYRFRKISGKCFFNQFSRQNDNVGIMRSIFSELGVVPGDALLSNCVIWVEGPSEIRWLRAWMKVYFEKYYKVQKKIKTNILEGLHYSVLMTGGSSISWLSFSEENHELALIEDQGLKVLRVNPNAFVVIDSDNSAKASAKYKRCIRIASELNEQNKYANPKLFIKQTIDSSNIHQVPNLWLLKGRELENYSHPEILKNFYEKVAGHTRAKVEGIKLVTDWDVFSESSGAGSILEGRGLTNIRAESGTLVHKQQLAEYTLKNLSEIHFNEDPSSILKPNKTMLDNLKANLERMFDYIVDVNNIE